MAWIIIIVVLILIVKWGVFGAENVKPEPPVFSAIVDIIKWLLGIVMTIIGGTKVVDGFGRNSRNRSKND